MTGVEQATAGDIYVAVIGAFALIAVALIQRWQGRRMETRLEERIGSPNGHGNVVQMLEALLAGQRAQTVAQEAMQAQLDILRADLQEHVNDGGAHDVHEGGSPPGAGDLGGAAVQPSPHRVRGGDRGVQSRGSDPARHGRGDPVLRLSRLSGGGGG